jgi:hypothetical protein
VNCYTGASLAGELSWPFSRELTIVRRSFWLAVLAYLVPTFPLGYFWHLVTFADRYHRLEMYRDEVIIPLGLASMVIQALVFAWAYARLFPPMRTPWQRGAVAFGCIFAWAYPRLFPPMRTPWQRGAVAFGCIFGAMAWSFAVLPVAAKYRMTSVQDFILLETCFTALQFAVVSPLIAMAYWLGEHKAASALSG